MISCLSIYLIVSSLEPFHKQFIAHNSNSIETWSNISTGHQLSPIVLHMPRQHSCCVMHKILNIQWLRCWNRSESRTKFPSIVNCDPFEKWAHNTLPTFHDCFILHNSDRGDVIKWKHFPHYWPFVRGIHRSPVNSPHKGQWRGALMFSLICAWINGWVNYREAGDLRCHRAHYDVTVMQS